MAKHGNMDLNRIEAVLNKLGGVDGVSRFLDGRTSVVHTSTLKPWGGDLPQGMVRIKLKEFTALLLPMHGFSSRSKWTAPEIHRAATQNGYGLASNGDLEYVRRRNVEARFIVQIIGESGFHSGDYRLFENFANGGNQSIQTGDDSLKEMEFDMETEFVFFKFPNT